MTALLSLTLVDKQGYTMNKRIELATEVDPADYLINGAAIATDLAAVSECQIIKATVQIAVPGAPFGLVGAAAYVDKGATITGWVDGIPGKKASTKIPSPESTFVNTDGTIKMTEALMIAYLAHYLAAGDALLSDGESIDAWIGGKVDK
jgi:hypothetical protein